MGLEEALGFRDKLRSGEKSCHEKNCGHGKKLGHEEKPGVKLGLEKAGLCPSFVLGGCVTRGTQEDPGNGCTKGNMKYIFFF